MARIFDNIDQDLLNALRARLSVSKRADFCLPRRSWSVIQEIDEIVATGVGLSATEADYVGNYDVKYRLGVDLDD